MSSRQLTADALALPLAERAALAQTLWESTEEDLPYSDPVDTAHEAVCRGEELSSGIVIGESHEDVMAAMRRAAA